MTISARRVAILCVVALLAGCKGTPWVIGQWLLVDEHGKPGSCHAFDKDRSFKVYLGGGCEGTTDPLLSGKWQLKKEDRLALQRGAAEIARVVRIVKRDEQRAVVQGALAGTLYRVGADGAAPLASKLRQSGVITVRPLDDATCERLGTSVADLARLPKEKAPRMLRARDQGLRYHADARSGDATVSKVVFALNLDQLDWVAFHLGEAAFAAPGPTARLEATLGPAAHSLVTGKGRKQQHVVMWKAYCPTLRGSSNVDVDITLFATPGEREGLYYISEGLVANIWEELKATIADPDRQPEEEEENEEGEAPADEAATEIGEPAAAPEPAAATPPPKPAPKSPDPAAAVAPTPPPRPLPTPPVPAQPAAKPGAPLRGPAARPVIPGDDDI